MKNIVCFIPARFESSRLPGKPLLDIAGVCVINRVYLQVKKCKLINDIIVLTDDERIKLEVERIGGKVEMVMDECLNGTERIVNFLNKNPNICDIVVNVQGDEPFVNPLHIDQCIRNYYKQKFNIELGILGTDFKNDYFLKCTTLCHILDKKELKNRSIGKVILNKHNDIMYCSRNVIPSSKYDEINQNATYYGHIGVFVFEKEYLMKEYMIENTQHQLNEDIEWLKILENRYRINVSVVDNPERGIDTIEDYKYFTDKYNNL